MLSQIEAAFLARLKKKKGGGEKKEERKKNRGQASEAQAVRSEERMRQFVADASHELRTPLTRIRGFAELYRQGARLAGSTANVLPRRIEDEAARMGLLVEDLLLLARLDGAAAAARSGTTWPADHRRCQAAQRHRSRRTIEVDLGPAAGALVVSGDEARLRQVIGNLVTNALTHTPVGTEVTVGVCGRRATTR